MDKRKLFRGNGILILVSIVLAAVLMVFLLWNHREEQINIQRLVQEKADETTENSTVPDTDSNTSQNEVVEQAEEPGTATEQTAVSSEDSKDDQQQEDYIQQDILQKSDQIEGISFRGDSFCSDEDIEDKGLGINLKKVFEENGIDLPVTDYTMYEAGSLSHMRLAGIEQSELDAYIESHKANLDSDKLRITEVKVRDLSQEELERDDQNYLPIISIGYYGGWGYDFDELCEQQQKILDTYQQRDKYLILGVYPAGCSDRQGYLEKMEQTWGEYYIMLDDTMNHSVSTEEGKKETAQRIFDKMVELGYLDGIQVGE